MCVGVCFGGGSTASIQHKSVGAGAAARFCAGLFGARERSETAQFHPLAHTAPEFSEVRWEQRDVISAERGARRGHLPLAAAPPSTTPLVCTTNAKLPVGGADGDTWTHGHVDTGTMR